MPKLIIASIQVNIGVMKAAGFRVGGLVLTSS